MNKFSHRKNVISAIIICVCCIYVIRLFYMQVIDDSFQMKAILNSQRIATQYPARGLIYDRNQKLLVENQPAYDLMVIPRQVKDFDTMELISILGIEKEMLVKNLTKCRRYSPYKSSILISQITANKYAVLQEKLYKYAGFFMQTRTLRKYNVSHSADVFGYIGEVSQSMIDRDSSYASGDYIGIDGLEKSYENILKGEKGEKILLVDNYNRVKGSYRNGEYDKQAIVGNDLVTTLDAELQEYAYQLMRNKKGGIIAIEPSTGEILLKVSSPGYDPQLLIGLERGKNYRKLQEDENLPLFDRTVKAAYPPGSTFKTLQALIGLQEGVITAESRFECHKGYSFGSLRMGCHNHASPLDLRHSIQNSCNPYYVNVWRRILENGSPGTVRDAYGKWREYITSFGLGQKICPDFTNELSGSVPSQDYYDRVYKTQNWKWTYIMSISIGQGELLITPLQIANMAACIANRGYYITPHIVRPIEGFPNQVEKHTIPIDASNFEIVIDGMEMAAAAGTARGAGIDSIIVCGKTGTVQNPHGADHSVFMAFAPRENPKIAIAVYVENGIWGATYACPIAGLLMEKYLKGKISEKKKEVDQRMKSSSLINLPSKEEQAEIKKAKANQGD
ncbi:MAG: penicillin-binding protein 2 [Odoribacter sp.]